MSVLIVVDDLIALAYRSLHGVGGNLMRLYHDVLISSQASPRCPRLKHFDTFQMHGERQRGQCKLHSAGTETDWRRPKSQGVIYQDERSTVHSFSSRRVSDFSFLPLSNLLSRTLPNEIGLGSFISWEHRKRTIFGGGLVHGSNEWAPDARWNRLSHKLLLHTPFPHERTSVDQ